MIIKNNFTTILNQNLNETKKKFIVNKEYASKNTFLIIKVIKLISTLKFK
jgi:hypothetical protein